MALRISFEDDFWKSSLPDGVGAGGVPQVALDEAVHQVGRQITPLTRHHHVSKHNKTNPNPISILMPIRIWIQNQHNWNNPTPVGKFKFLKTFIHSSTSHITVLTGRVRIGD